MVLGDVCNNYVHDYFAPPLHLRATKPMPNMQALADGYRELFLTPRGSIIAVAAQEGEYAMCDYTGAFFTKAFLDNITKAVSTNNKPKWQWILYETKQDLNHPYRQTPDYQVTL